MCIRDRSGTGNSFTQDGNTATATFSTYVGTVQPGMGVSGTNIPSGTVVSYVVVDPTTDAITVHVTLPSSASLSTPGDPITFKEFYNSSTQAYQAAAAAQVNGTTSSTTALVVNNNVGTIAVGDVVTGTGISGSVTVVSLSNQNNLVLSSAQSLTLDNPGLGSRIQDLSKVYNYEVDYDFGDKFDFGKVIGIKQTSAQITNYSLEEAFIRTSLEWILPILNLRAAFLQDQNLAKMIIYLHRFFLLQLYFLFVQKSWLLDVLQQFSRQFFVPTHRP